jgi:hypothetical protein
MKTKPPPPISISERIAALADMKNATKTAIRQKLSTLSEEKKQEVLNHPKVTLRAEAIRTAASPSSTSLDDFLPPHLRGKRSKRTTPPPTPRKPMENHDWIPESFVIFWTRFHCRRCACVHSGPTYGWEAASTLVKLRYRYTSKLNTHIFLRGYVPLEPLPTETFWSEARIPTCPECTAGPPVSNGHAEPELPFPIDHRELAIRAHYERLLRRPDPPRRGTISITDDQVIQRMRAQQGAIIDGKVYIDAETRAELERLDLVELLSREGIDHLISLQEQDDEEA